MLLNYILYKIMNMTSQNNYEKNYATTYDEI